MKQIMKEASCFILSGLILGIFHMFFVGWASTRAYQVYHIYLFLLPLSSVLLLFCLWVHYLRPDHTGYVYMICGIIKILASVAFLYPIMTDPKYLRKFVLIHYMLAYFGVLFIEVVLLATTLTKDNAQDSHS